MSDATLTFLQHILPHEGWLHAIVITSAGRFPRWFASFEEQARQLLRWSEAGYEAYHACASFREPTKRTQKNVHRVQSLWMDVDTREGKADAPYADRQEAIQALGEFCIAVPLPRPLVVSSGYGLHVYWMFDTALSLDDWLPYAEGLRAAAAKHKFHIDTKRTCDAASILRPVGTFNHKHAA